MVYDKTKLHTLIFLTCILLYLVSPSHKFQVPIEQVQAKEAKTKTGSMEGGVVEAIQTRGKEDITKNVERGKMTGKIGNIKENMRKICNADCKARHIVSLGINERIAYSLVYTCKNSAVDPVNCIKLGASIVWAETTGGKTCKNNNCMNVGGFKFDTIELGMEDWVKRYNRLWYKQKTPSSFYNNVKGSIPKTKYCMSENDTNINGYCPHGYKNSWSMFNKIQF